MWMRFTERARKVVFYGQEEAAQLGENYVSTEHLLLGLLRDEDTVAVRVLERMDVDLEALREAAQRNVARGPGRAAQDMQLTPRAKKVIDLAFAQAQALKDNYIGTEHLLLGLVGEGEGFAAKVLTGEMNVQLAAARDAILALRAEAKNEDPASSADASPGDISSQEPYASLRDDPAALQEFLPIYAITLLTQARKQSAEAIVVRRTPEHISTAYQINNEFREEAEVPHALGDQLIAAFVHSAGLDIEGAGDTGEIRRVLGMGDVIYRVTYRPAEEVVLRIVPERPA